MERLLSTGKNEIYRIDREEEKKRGEMQYEISRRPGPMRNQMNSLKCRGKKRKRPKMAEKNEEKVEGEKEESKKQKATREI